MEHPSRAVLLPWLMGIALVGTSLTEGPPHDPPHTETPPPFLAVPTPWADSLIATLSMEKQIAQLMMVAAYSNKDGKHEEVIEKLVRERHIGGLIFFQGGPYRQARLTERYQQAAQVPLLLGMDLEWGLSMRLDSTMRFPRQMLLGALHDDAPVEAMGLEIARQMNRIGVHVSFSPVVDVNNNPRNPVIDDRSFGEDRENVLRKGLAYMRGLQRGGVLAVAKHFPGHGDVDSDSHHTLPFIAHPRERLDSLELWPFRRMAGAGLSAVMVAHLEVAALDSTKGLPSTLSKAIVHDLLLGELGFQGLVFTDALNMKGVANAERPGEIELRALLAGNDVMLFPQDPVKAIERIRKAVIDGEVDSARIAHSCLKILRAKEWAGLAQRSPIALSGIAGDLDRPEARVLRHDLHAGAITVVRDHHGLLPLHGPREREQARIASVVIGGEQDNPFHRALKRHADVATFRCDKDLGADALKRLLEDLGPYDVVIASVHGTTWRKNKEYGVPASAFNIVKAIAAKKRTVHVHFTNPYRLLKADGPMLMATTVLAYEETDDAMQAAADALFGVIPSNGRLPVTAQAMFRANDGVDLRATGRLRDAAPEALGIRTSALAGIDSIVFEGIKAKAFPGCQVLVAVDGQVIVDRVYGHHTYEAKRPVRQDDLYDLASITKVAATTLALMALVDDGHIAVNDKLGKHLPELEKSHPQHAKMTLRDILTHQAGLKAFVPFYTRIRKNGGFKPNTVSPSRSEEYPIRIGEELYLHKTYQDSLLRWTLDTPLREKSDYLYSDMGYYLLQALVERITGTTLDRFTEERFYRPIGATTLGYRPLERFPLDRIAPTEKDTIFRKRLVHGDVHDPGAAMMGGVAGHAGLFGSARDLAKVMQMLLDGGTYGGRRYISEETVKEFTKCQFCKPDGNGNRRALGFDRPVAGGKGPTCDCVSYTSFGHTGFTGTMAWADPESRVVYIFLSNRVYPDAEPNKLVKAGTRTRIQEVVHAAVAARVKPGPMSTVGLGR